VGVPGEESGEDGGSRRVIEALVGVSFSSAGTQCSRFGGLGVAAGKGWVGGEGGGEGSQGRGGGEGLTGTVR